MSVTAVLRLQARPGQVDALLAAGAMLYKAALRDGALEAVRALQGLSDANSVLVLGEWHSREAYWATRSQDQVGEAMVALCAGPPKRYFFERLGYYEDMSRRAVIAAANFLRVPADAAASFGDFLRREGRVFTANAPGLAYRYAYQDADDPTHYLMYTAWDSPTAWERFQQERAPAIRASLDARGVTTEPFFGHTHADADRYGTGGG
jgi:heme-degrading monooxygenase HmoA